jgi:Tol biopolymer transport system component
MSDAGNLVPDDTNGATDAFVRDRVKGTTERVSVSSTGAQANRDSTGCVITADGRFVVFGSTATNLVSAKDTNKAEDIFVRDRVKGTTERVTTSRTGTQANGPSYSPDISDDGRYVSFQSTATNLVAGDTSSQRTDVFVYDRERKRMSRESVSPAGKEANNASGGAQITPDGRYLIFRSYASNLVKGDTNRKLDIFLRDLTTRTTVLLDLGFPGYNRDGGVHGFTLSADGQWIAFTALVPVSPSIDGGGTDYENVFVMRVPR